jgi:class 3 adenylate cyclase
VVTAGIVGASSGLRKHGVVGDTVNTAARLQSAAPVGCVLVGEETKRHLPPDAVVEERAPLDLKGKEEPVQAYVLRSVPEPEAQRRRTMSGLFRTPG